MKNFISSRGFSIAIAIFAAIGAFAGTMADQQTERRLDEMEDKLKRLEDRGE